MSIRLARKWRRSFTLNKRFKMNTVKIEKDKKRLIKRFHTLLGAARLDDDGKMQILSAYGVTTSKDLSVAELLEICNKMNDMLNGGKYSEMDALRKRVLAAGCSFMRANGQEANIDYVKGWVCRRAKKKSFNAVPADRLRAAYFAFNNQRKALEETKAVVAEVRRQGMNQDFYLN